MIQKVNPYKEAVQAIITAPTRELATQIYQEVLKITKNSEEEIAVRLYIGGTDKQRTIEKLKHQPHIVVGTPGRINDLVKEQALLVHSAPILIIDEADLMLEMGFLEGCGPDCFKNGRNFANIGFLSNDTEKLKPFLKKYMENPKYIQVEPKQVTAAQN